MTRLEIIEGMTRIKDLEQEELEAELKKLLKEAMQNPNFDCEDWIQLKEHFLFGRKYLYDLDGNEFWFDEFGRRHYTRNEG